MAKIVKPKKQKVESPHIFAQDLRILVNTNILREIMDKKGHFTGTYNDGKNKLEVSLLLIVFEDSGTQVVYCPALELSGYGKNESEAENSFQTSLGEFILYTTRKNTLRDELVKTGWKISNKI
jgi:hypothetical protein